MVQKIVFNIPTRPIFASKKLMKNSFIFEFA